MIFYPQEKSLNNITSLVKFTVKIVSYYGIGFVGDTNLRFLRLNKITNPFRRKSFIAQNRFAFQIYLAQKFNGTL